MAGALWVAACAESVGPPPERGSLGTPLFSFSPNGITLSRVNGSLNESGQQLAKGFDPKNPHLGDAIIATFYWLGSTNLIDSVIDFVADANNTRAGNQYHLVEYVTAGDYSMATYVATNAQNFPDTSSTSGQILAVRAYLREPVLDGGVKISSWAGVEDNFAAALGAHRSATGSDTTITVARAGPITVAAGAVAYTVTMSGLFGLDGPQNGQAYTSLGQGSDHAIKEEGAFRVFPSGGTTDPQWTWFYGPARGTWLVTTLALNPGTGSANQPPTAAFTSSCSGLTCGFTSTSGDPDGPIASHSWTFGDGGTSTLQNPSHSYAAGGSYTVTLTVTDNQGAASTPTSEIVTVTVPNQPPVAAFTQSCGGLACSFTSTSTDPDGSIASYSWTFGDGGTSTLQSPAHTYATGGTYTVTLTVTDNQGATNSTSTSVTVTASNQPPVAAFTQSCGELACNFTSTSSDPEGSIASYSWTFGDGGTSTLQNPSHTYATGGTYTVILTVTDNQGATNATSQSVTVTPPNQPPVAGFTQSCSGLACTFTNTSSDPDGPIAGYSWAFGDGGTSTLQNPSHTYATGGTYTVTLTVADDQGGTNSTSKSVTVNRPPAANFTFSCSLLACSFTSTSSDPDGPITSYSWTFGDGSTSTLQNPSRTYATGGTYTVTLTVTDNQGATNALSKSVTVNRPPVANFTFSCSLLACSFTSTSSDPDGPIASYSWAFGDGGTSTLQNPSRTYATGGTYTVTLTVTDNQGATNSTSKSVTVNRPPTVNAGPDAMVVVGLLYTLSWSFSDPDNDGPWSYTIDWGDGSSPTTGSKSSQGTFSTGHTYVLPLGTHTIRVTVTDAHGASGSDTKVVTIVL